MIWDSLLAQITATVGSNKDVVLNTDATKVLVCLQKVEVEELCTMTLAVRQSKAQMLLGKLSKVSGATIEVIENEL